MLVSLYSKAISLIFPASTVATSLLFSAFEKSLENPPASTSYLPSFNTLTSSYSTLLSGLPVSGLLVSGLPVSGLPVSGFQVSVLHVSVLRVSGLLVSGLAVSGLPISGFFVSLTLFSFSFFSMFLYTSSEIDWYPPKT